MLILVTGYVVIVLENTNKATTLGSPYYANLTTMGMLLGNYEGKIYPSITIINELLCLTSSLICRHRSSLPGKY
jgi:hypothetical protein